MEDRLLTTAEVAERLRVKPSTLRYWRHVGYGPASFKAGRHSLYREVDIDKWIADQLQQAGIVA